MATPDGYFDMSKAPVSIASVRLKVRDVEGSAGFYERVLGLTRLARSDRSVTLGTDEVPLLHLDGDPSCKPRDPRQAGLFHTAFLMPSRADLARWMIAVAEARVPLQGASDHIVSEAFYLSDPEGNGIEVYADRPTGRWRDGSGEIHMTTEPLDVDDLRRAAGGTRWSTFPRDGLIGHVHLQVGDVAEAERFYHGVLGLDVASRYGGASFFGSGGYHHQLAGNVWYSEGAGPRDPSLAGLAEVVLRADPAERTAITARTGGDHFADPWGTAFVLAD